MVQGQLGSMEARSRPTTRADGYPRRADLVPYGRNFYSQLQTSITSYCALIFSRLLKKNECHALARICSASEHVFRAKLKISISCLTPLSEITNSGRVCLGMLKHRRLGPIKAYRPSGACRTRIVPRSAQESSRVTVISLQCRLRSTAW